MKPVLTIHEVDEWMLGLPLHEYTLTFDDGLFTQYMYFDELKKIDTHKIFFISTGIVAEETTEQSSEFITCEDAHQKLLMTSNLEHYMNWSQIHEIHEHPQCEIGGHSHMHIKHTGFNSVNDTRLMMNTFHEQGINPESFCFPYNDMNPVYKCVLEQSGFKKFYGDERLDIYDLLHSTVSR